METFEQDLSSQAASRLTIGPVPDWVAACRFASDFKSETPGSVTLLLIERQLHAERRETFVRTVARLETMEAVQRYSQWRLEFSTRFETVTLHSVKITRAGVDAEHAIREKIQFLRREAGLEGFVIDGVVTLLLLLEDVRPGDILEWAYTLHSEPPLLPESCAHLFAFPENAQIGKYQFAVHFAESRPLKWKSSSAALTPTQERSGGDVLWLWAGENYTSPEREAKAPSWYITAPWIQISDCVGWQDVATAFYRAWQRNGSGEALSDQVKSIVSAEADIRQRVERAIRFVQDEFRYLSVNLELGGQVPADSDTVVRRRYGDCKDLAFLLVQLLKGLDVQARPVLVNTAVRHSIKDLLPSPRLFNHAVVEYTIGSETRWVDTTLKAQGGNALNRAIPDYGPGLPIDETSAELVKAPTGSLECGVYELKHSFLIDTDRGWSRLAETVVATGLYADNLRLQFQREGQDAIARRRLQEMTNQFSQCQRVKSLEFRDDRDANHFVLAEVFEINGFLLRDGTSRQCWLRVPNLALAGNLTAPPDGGVERRTPLALLHPCNIVYTIEVESQGLGVAAWPACKFKNDFFTFSSSSKGVRKFIKGTFAFRTLSDAVLPAQLREYRNKVKEVIGLSALTLRLPPGYPRMRVPSGFGDLPAGPSVTAETGERALTGDSARHTGSHRRIPPRNVAVINSLPEGFTDKAREAAYQTVLLDEPPRRQRSRHRRRRRLGFRLTKSEVLIALAFFVTVALAMFFVSLLGHSLR